MTNTTATTEAQYLDSYNEVVVATFDPEGNHIEDVATYPATSQDDAIAVLEANGWHVDRNGQPSEAGPVWTVTR